MHIKLDRWAILTITMVLIALFFGLRPHAWFVDNDARWLPNHDGLQFMGNGIAYVRDLRPDMTESHPDAFTIELVATPGTVQIRGFSPLLVLSDGSDDRQLAVWQYLGSLIVMNGDDYDYRQRRPRVVARDVFSAGQVRMVTITSCDRGTRLYMDGVLAAAKESWRLTIPRNSQPLHLVLGNSLYAKHGWYGRLHGLALFTEAIGAEEIEHRYDQWAGSNDFSRIHGSMPQPVYSFGKLSGQTIGDETGGERRLELPRHLKVLKRSFLSVPGRKEAWNRNLFGDMLINVIGFIPLGLVFRRFLSRTSRMGNSTIFWMVVLACLMLSLAIEIVQAWIPGRTSSLTDLVLNTTGGMLGAWVGKQPVDRL